VYDARSAHAAAQSQTAFAQRHDARAQCAMRFAMQMHDTAKVSIKQAFFTTSNCRQNIIYARVTRASA